MTPVRQTDRAFGLTFAVIFTIVFAVAGLVWDVWWQWPLIVAGALAIVATWAPGVLLPFNRLWMRLVARISVINNYLLLGLFFFFIVTPTGSVMRLFGWDPMMRPCSKNASYWTSVNRHTDSETIRDMF